MDPIPLHGLDAVGRCAARVRSTEPLGVLSAPSKVDTLLTLAEVAIAMAGLSAVVVIFKICAADLWSINRNGRLAFRGLIP